MTPDDLLSRLDGVRRTSRGWAARCPVPAHDDHSPSLSIREGERGLLLHCFSGCTLEEICRALDLDVADLFYDKPGIPARYPSRSEPRPLTTREMERKVWSRAVAYELRGLTVLDMARGMDTTEWTDDDFDAAMSAVCSAREDLRVAKGLHSLAAAMRATINHPRTVADEDRPYVA